MRQLSSGFWCQVLAVVAVCLAANGVATAASWQEPEHWSKIGSVQDWMNLDARFYRTYDDTRFVDRSQFRLEQQKHYDATRLYGGQLPQIGLEEFLALPEKERRARAEEAAKKLVYVERYLRRVRGQVNNLQENLSSNVGSHVSDTTVLADCLNNLGDAVELDPSNPYSWHLQSYFAMCAGDFNRSRQYLDGAVSALARIPEDQLVNIRTRVALDLAWNQRDRGEFLPALGNVVQAERLGGRTIETQLLRGLIFAVTGESEQATTVASTLRQVDVAKFPNNLRTSDFQPELQDPNRWTKKKSNYLSAWITALMLIQEGNRELASASFGSYSMDDMYPFGWRFWNDAGRIYEVTGRNSEALRAWNTARINRPWLRNMVYKPYDIALGVLTGHEGKVPYLLGYDRFYITGSRLAYAASMVGRVGSAETEAAKQEWSLKALDELEICQRAGIYPGQASVLQGHVYYLMGDMQSAMGELEQALGFLEKQGDDKIQEAVLRDLNAIMASQQAADMQAFFKQSGNSKGRWEADVDPAAKEKELKAQVADNPDSWKAIVELARFQIRHGQPAEGRALVMSHENQRSSVSGVTLLLEADRLLGDPQLALEMVQKLDAGAASHWDSSGLWSLVGSICLEHGQESEAGRAWQHALDLDPENQGLRMQLRLMGQ